MQNCRGSVLCAAIALFALKSTVVNVAGVTAIKPAYCNFGYRLGDFVKGFITVFQGISVERYSECWPGTIGAAYGAAAENTWDNFSVLCSLTIPNPEIPKNNSVVLHLRLGDTADISAWKNTKPGRSYVESYEYYEKAIEKIPSNITDVVIVFSTTHKTNPGDADKTFESLVVVGEVTGLFEQKGFDVSFRQNNSADEDFVFMSHSSYFIPAGGGYSSKAAECAKRNGGKILYGKKPVLDAWHLPNRSNDLSSW